MSITLGIAVTGGLLAPALAAPGEAPPDAPRAATGTRYAQARSQTNTPAAAPEGQPNKPGALTVPIGPDKGNPAPNPPGNPPGPAGGTPSTAAPVTAPAAPVTPVTPTVPTQPVPGAAEAQGREVATVRVVGARVIPEPTILLRVATKTGTAFSVNQIQLDLNSIASLGFFASVTYQVTPNLQDANKVDVTFVVIENRVVTCIKFTGNTLIKTTDLEKSVTTKIGSVLNQNTVNTDVTKIEDQFKAKGFAGLVTDVHQGEDGCVTFTIQQAKICRIELTGLKHTNKALVLRQIRSKAGDEFNQTRLRQDLSRIYDLGFFEEPPQLKVDNDPLNPGCLVVTMVMKERRTGQFSVGIGFDNRSKLTGFVSLGESNLGGTGKRVSASVEAGGQRTYDLSFSNPFIGRRNAGYDISIFDRTIFREPRSVQRLAPTASTTFAYEERRTGARLNYDLPLDEDHVRSLIFGFRDEKARLFQSSGVGVITPVNLPVFAGGRTTGFSTGFLHDKRDSRIDPSRGGREQIIVEKGLAVLGGTAKFAKLDLDLRRYVPLMPGKTLSDPPKLIAAARFVGGKSFGQLPAFEQYFIGGSDTVRGYDVDEQFGDNQDFANFELRYRLQKKMQLVAFSDIGTAYGGRFASQTGVNRLFSVGLGLRLQTPVGPIRLDVGKGRRGVRTHFAIGPTF